MLPRLPRRALLECLASLRLPTRGHGLPWHRASPRHLYLLGTTLMLDRRAAAESFEHFRHRYPADYEALASARGMDREGDQDRSLDRNVTMTPKAALAFIERNGIVLERAKGNVPSLVDAIVGAPVRGSWWAHADAHRIFKILGAVHDSSDVLRCRLVDEKVTYPH